MAPGSSTASACAKRPESALADKADSSPGSPPLSATRPSLSARSFATRRARKARQSAEAAAESSSPSSDAPACADAATRPRRRAGRGQPTRGWTLRIRSMRRDSERAAVLFETRHARDGRARAQIERQFWRYAGRVHRAHPLTQCARAGRGGGGVEGGRGGVRAGPRDARGAVGGRAEGRHSGAGPDAHRGWAGERGGAAAGCSEYGPARHLAAGDRGASRTRPIQRAADAKGVQRSVERQRLVHSPPFALKHPPGGKRPDTPAAPPQEANAQYTLDPNWCAPAVAVGCAWRRGAGRGDQSAPPVAPSPFSLAAQETPAGGGGR